MNSKAIVKERDMQDEWFLLIKDACEKVENTFKDEKDIAKAVKDALETHLEGRWQVVVGCRTYGSSITHEDGCLLNIYVGKHAYLLWKSA